MAAYGKHDRQRMSRFDGFPPSHGMLGITLRGLSLRRVDVRERRLAGGDRAFRTRQDIQPVKVVAHCLISRRQQSEVGVQVLRGGAAQVRAAIRQRRKLPIEAPDGALGRILLGLSFIQMGLYVFDFSVCVDLAFRQQRRTAPTLAERQVGMSGDAYLGI
jgi:hypothetical protein